MSALEPQVVAFPVQIPDDFSPWEIVTRKGVRCPGQDLADGFRPRWGGGFDAPRGPLRLRHRAVDVMCAIGAEIRAVDAGRVQLVWRYAGTKRPGAGKSTKGGFYVRVEHAWGVTYYAHLAREALVGPGDPIVGGQLLGYAGRTGNAAPGCPHLHLSMTRGAKLIDPMPLLKPLYVAGGWKRQASEL